MNKKSHQQESESQQLTEQTKRNEDQNRKETENFPRKSNENRIPFLNFSVRVAQRTNVRGKETRF